MNHHAFWHRSRRTFVPMAVNDFAIKNRIGHDQAQAILNQLCTQWLAKATFNHKAHMTCYDLTQTAKDDVMAQMMKESV